MIGYQALFYAVPSSWEGTWCLGAGVSRTVPLDSSPSLLQAACCVTGAPVQEARELEDILWKPSGIRRHLTHAAESPEALRTAPLRTERREGDVRWTLRDGTPTHAAAGRRRPCRDTAGSNCGHQESGHPA